MKFDYRKYPITSVVIGICVIVYIYTTLKYGIEMNVYQGIESGGFNPILVIHLKVLLAFPFTKSVLLN